MGSVTFYMNGSQDKTNIFLRKAKLLDSEAVHSLRIAGLYSEQSVSVYGKQVIKDYVDIQDPDQYKELITAGNVWVAVKPPSTAIADSPSEELIVGFGAVCQYRTPPYSPEYPTEELSEGPYIFEIKWLYIHTEWFQHGIGSKLIRQLEQQALSLGCKVINVHASRNACTLLNGFKTYSTIGTTGVIIRV